MNIKSVLSNLNPLGLLKTKTQEEKFKAKYGTEVSSCILGDILDFGLKADTRMLNSKLSPNVNSVTQVEEAELESAISSMLQLYTIINLGSIIKSKYKENSFIILNLKMGHELDRFADHKDSIQNYEIIKQAIKDLGLIYYCGDRALNLRGDEDTIDKRTKKLTDLFEYFNEEKMIQEVIVDFNRTYDGSVEGDAEPLVTPEEALEATDEVKSEETTEVKVDEVKETTEEIIEDKKDESDNKEEDKK